MNEKKRFGKKLLSIALATTMVSSVAVVAATTTSASAVTNSSVSTKAVQPTTGDASTFSWDNATVYFLLTDRFYNGDKSNDHEYGRGLDQDGNVVSDADADKTGFFQGGDFAGITQKIEDGYFNDLGVNAIWLSAPYEQIHGYVVGGDGSKSFAHYSYHGYYVLDYTESDKNFGTKEEFRKLVDTAHSHGIRIVMDIVMNHSGYNSLKDMVEYGYGPVASGWDSYYYPHKNVNNKDYHSFIDYDDSPSARTSWAKWWGADWIRCGLPGYTNGGGGDLTMCLAGLPDFKTDQSTEVGIPEILKTKWTNEGTYSSKVAEYGASNTVTGYLSDWLAEWVREFGVDGFRCDTAKHVELENWKTLKQKCVKALRDWKAENPDKKLDDLDFWMTGECFGHGVAKSPYFTDGGFDSMINFEFASAAGSSSIPSAGNAESVYSRYASSINNDPTFNMLSYISSHDTVIAQGDKKYNGSFMLMLPGAIQIYYGDESNRPQIPIPAGSSASAGHQLRSFMNWDTLDQDILSHWQKVGNFRNKHLAVGAGQHKQISAYSSSTGYTFSRTYDDGNIQDSVVATLFAPKNTSLAVNVGSVWGDGTVVTNAYDNTTATVSGGKATFNTGDNGTILIEGPQSSISMSLKSTEGTNSFYDSTTLTLKLKGADYATVTVDNGTPFQIKNGESFKIGENSPVATKINVSLTASNSEDTVTKTYVYTKKDPNAVVKLYFDNTGYNWSRVYAYIYDESSKPVVENSAWPGQAMTLNPSTGYYEIEVPENLLGDGGKAIFTEGSSSANRYPSETQGGLSIRGTSHKFSQGNVWEEFEVTNPPQPTQPTQPTQPPQPTQPTQPPEPSVTYMIGDVSGDNDVTLVDVLMSQRISLGIIEGTKAQKLAADVNKDGVISTTDHVIMLRYMVGFENTYNLGTIVSGGNTNPTEAPTQVSGNTVYLDFSALQSGNERFAIWTWPTGGEGQWVNMTKNSSGIYQAEMPNGCTNVIFVRMNGSTTTNSWDNKLNQSADLTYDSSKPTYKATSWANNSFNGSWS